MLNIYSFFSFWFLPGLYHGIGSRSGKAKRGKRRIAEETGILAFVTPNYLFLPYHTHPLKVSVSVTNSKPLYLPLIDCGLVTAGGNDGNTEKSGAKSI